MREIVFVACFLGIFFLFAIPAMAQKDNQQSLITQEQINQINEIVKPLKERPESQLNEDRMGDYKAYQDEIKRMSSSKSYKEKKRHQQPDQGEICLFF